MLSRGYDGRLRLSPTAAPAAGQWLGALALPASAAVVLTLALVAV